MSQARSALKFKISATNIENLTVIQRDTNLYEFFHCDNNIILWRQKGAQQQRQIIQGRKASNNVFYSTDLLQWSVRNDGWLTNDPEVPKAPRLL